MEFKLGEYRIALSDQQVVKVKLTKDAAGELRWQTVEVLTQAIADDKALREQAKLVSAAQNVPWHFGITPGGLVNNRYSVQGKNLSTNTPRDNKVTELVTTNEQKHSATNVLPAIKPISGNEFKLLIAENPNRAITFASERVESCSYLLRELYDDPDQDLNDWLGFEGAELDEFEPQFLDIEAFDVVYPDIAGIPSVSLRMSNILHYLPLTHAN